MKTLKEALFSRKNLKSNPFGLTEDDLEGDLEGFPMGVVVRMLEEQSKQRGKKDISSLQRSRRVGFLWVDTQEGWEFWDRVLNYSDFDLFFEKYPGYVRYNLT